MEGEEHFDDSLEASSTSINKFKGNDAGGHINNSNSVESYFTMAREDSRTTVDPIPELPCIEKLVPLYRGDVTKTQISFQTAKITSTSALNVVTLKDDSASYNPLKSIDGSANITACNKPRNKRRYRFGINTNTNIETGISVKPIKSYLGIFHLRNGHPGAGGKSKPEVQDTTRSIFGDTNRSLLSTTSVDKEEFVDARDKDSDSLSFYVNHIEQEQRSKQPLQQISSNSTLFLSPPKSVASSTAGLQSISESVETNHCTTCTKTNKKSSNVVRAPPVPILGKLGPDTAAIQEKLERRKKQINYGQNASTRNRLKILEMNIIKKIKK